MSNNTQATETQLKRFFALMVRTANERNLTIDEMTKTHVAQSMIRNEMAREKTAKELDIDRKTLYRKLIDIREHVEGV